MPLRASPRGRRKGFLKLETSNMKLKLFSIFFFATVTAAAQNPIIRDQFTADPTARVFNDKVYLYPSHDIVPPQGQRQDWFCMADYHVFSSENLSDWTDHGVILSQEQVPWGKPDGYSMWAPDCVEKDGKYYFYFPDAPRNGRGFAIGVAVADSPEGPFTCEPEPIKGISGIDPCVLVDDDGQAYIYWSGMGIRGAKLKANMKELDGKLKEVTMPRREGSPDMPPIIMGGEEMKGLPEGFKEGPFAFRRGDWYYLTFPWVRGKKGVDGDNPTETLAYAMSKSPLGPWDFKGIFMAEHENGCWTNHHSFVEYKGQWYLFYHRNDLSPNDDKRRSARIEKVKFNEDGTIAEIKPTTNGGGVVSMSKRPAYFTLVQPKAAPSQPDAQGFIRRWHMLEPIRQEIRSNVIFTDSWLRQKFAEELARLPKQKGKWYNLDSETYNMKLFRFAEQYGKQTYGSLFWCETTIDSAADIENVRLAVGSNGASMWWLNNDEVLLLEGDRRMVEDDGVSHRLTLKKGRNILRGAIINGPGLSDMCVRFIDEKGNPVTNYQITLK